MTRKIEKMMVWVRCKAGGCGLKVEDEGGERGVAKIFRVNQISRGKRDKRVVTRDYFNLFSRSLMPRDQYTTGPPNMRLYIIK